MEQRENRNLRNCRDRRRRRRRRKKTTRAAVLCVLLLVLILLIAGTAAAVYGLVKGDSREQNMGKTAKDISIDPRQDKSGQENPGENTAGSTDSHAGEDSRMKNTATEEHHKTNGLAICMYHYVYDKNDPPEDLNNNYIEVHALEEELKYLAENDYFFPTWEEVRQFENMKFIMR